MALGLPNALFAAFLTAKKKKVTRSRMSKLSDQSFNDYSGFRGRIKEKFYLLINYVQTSAQPPFKGHLYSGTLALVPRVSPELRFHCIKHFLLTLMTSFEQD